MAKMYSADGKIITGDNFPQITFPDKEGEHVVLVVDNRKSTFDKIQKLSRESQLNPKEDVDYEFEMLKLALGDKQSKKVKDMDLSVKSFKELSIYVMAAIQEEEYETIKEATEKN